MIVAGCLVLAGPLLFGCGNDDPVTPPPQKSSPYKNLQNKDDILFNLELAYNKRDFEQFEKLLDDSLIFVFSEEDFNAGDVPFHQWDRDHETNANQKILDPNLDGDQRLVTIDLSLDYTADDWTPEPPNQNHPDETWYKKTVEYFLVILTADGWEFRTGYNKKAELTIRRDDSTERWQIVLWRDEVRDSQGPAHGEDTVIDITWGIIKAQYYARPKDEG